jgi:hypothetical protein
MNKKMKVIKLTPEDYQRSLNAKGFNHRWLYSKQNTTQRTHNNSIFLTKTIGMPFACLVEENDSDLQDWDICEAFGKDIFVEGSVSPLDKERMNVDVFYIKRG